MKNIKLISLALLITTLGLISACDDDEVPEFNEEEVITDLVLTFTPQDGGTSIVVEAIDPDGEGPENLAPESTVNLESNTPYILTIELLNSVANQSITEEVEEEADEHMLFFSWGNGLFADPDGIGNISDRSNPVNYNDEDSNGLPLGISTTWTTTSGSATGDFRILLKHQPEMKSATSTATDGETDVDVTFEIQVQ